MIFMKSKRQVFQNLLKEILHDITEYEIKPTEKPTSTETTVEKVKHTSTNRIDAEATTQVDYEALKPLILCQ